MKAFKKVKEFKKVMNSYLDEMIDNLKEEGYDLDDVDCLDEDLGFMLERALEDCEI